MLTHNDFIIFKQNHGLCEGFHLGLQTGSLFLLQLFYALTLHDRLDLQATPAGGAVLCLLPGAPTTPVPSLNPPQRIPTWVRVAHGVAAV